MAGDHYKGSSLPIAAHQHSMQGQHKLLFWGTRACRKNEASSYNPSKKLLKGLNQIANLKLNMRKAFQVQSCGSPTQQCTRG